MPKQPIATIVNFCSNEARFIGACLQQALHFSRQVIVPVCDHFFDGTAENRPLLEQVYRAFPQCLFVEYPFIPSEIPRRIFKHVAPAHFWHSLSRLIGLHHLQPDIETVMFLDADEVADGPRFAEWLEASDYHHHTVMKFANYWYFREPAYQAEQWEDTIVLAQLKALTPDLLLRQEERDAIYDLLPGPKRRGICAADGQPMFHHFSWVRSKEEMLKKVRSWGHKNDRNWLELVEKEFSGPFQGTDFVHGYRYKTVVPKFALSEASFAPAPSDPKVTRLSQKELLQHLKFKKSPLFDWISGLIRN